MHSLSPWFSGSSSLFLPNITNNLYTGTWASDWLGLNEWESVMSSKPFFILWHCRLWCLSSSLLLGKGSANRSVKKTKKRVWIYFVQSSVIAAEVKRAFWRAIRLNCLNGSFSSSALTAFKIFGQDSWQELSLMCESMPPPSPSPYSPLKHPNYHSCHFGACELTHLFLMGWKLPQDAAQVVQLVYDMPGANSIFLSQP